MLGNRIGSKTGPLAPQTGLWAWGKNTGGTLGQGNSGSTHKSSPVQVGALTTWSTIATGYNGQAHAIKTDGTLWAWGVNDGYGELGLGDQTNRSSPVQVGALTNWSSISNGRAHSLSIKTDGTLWAWGANAYGQIGIGTATSFSPGFSPVQVGALTNWSKVSAGKKHSAAVKTDGTLWSWGLGDRGQLGHGNSTNCSSPVQVGALTTWSKVSAGFYHTLAIKTDGTLWSWGKNNKGQLGKGNTTYYSSPVQVGALTTWASVSASREASFAIKTDGTLWSWGYNYFANLGLGDTTDRSSPVQVGALTNWSQVSAAFLLALAIKTDGTLWAWGRGDSYGSLGDGAATTRNSPVQIGARTTWTKIAAGKTSFGIQS